MSYIPVATFSGPPVTGPRAGDPRAQRTAGGAPIPATPGPSGPDAAQTMSPRLWSVEGTGPILPIQKPRQFANSSAHLHA